MDTEEARWRRSRSELVAVLLLSVASCGGSQGADAPAGPFGRRRGRTSGIGRDLRLRRILRRGLYPRCVRLVHLHHWSDGSPNLQHERLGIRHLHLWRPGDRRSEPGAAGGWTVPARRGRRRVSRGGVPAVGHAISGARPVGPDSAAQPGRRVAPAEPRGRQAPVGRASTPEQAPTARSPRPGPAAATPGDG